MKNLQIAVVTGGHPFNVVAFHNLWHAMPKVDSYVQSLDDWAYDAKAAALYDVVVMYNFQQELAEKWKSTMQSVLGRREQGIIVLHHGLVAFKEWPLWNEITGIADRHNNRYKFDQDIPVKIENPAHPIAKGVEPYVIRDEIYHIQEPKLEAGELLFTTTHPELMRAIGWTHFYHDSRVFCLESGHGVTAYENPSFGRILNNALWWTAWRENEIA